MNWIKQHKLMILFLILAIAGLLYVSFEDSFLDIPGSGNGVLEQSNLEADADYNEALQMLSEVRKLSLDTTLFDSLEFKSLFDFKMPIEPQPLGRRNPFLPI
jgi:hypothetical protein